MAKPLPSTADLRRFLNYDPISGALTWRERDGSDFAGSEARARSWNERYVGTPALNHVDDQGYRVGRLVGAGGVKSHRVIWKMVYGEDPEIIDHINGVRDDNRLSNLRSVSHGVNSRNLGRSKSNTSGVNGVYWYPRYGRWMASIHIDGRRKNLGYFDKKQDAIAARAAADRIAGYSTWRVR